MDSSSTYIITNFKQLNRFVNRPGLISLDHSNYDLEVLGLKDNDRYELEHLIDKFINDCGCKEGFIAGLFTLLCTIYMVWWKITVFTLIAMIIGKISKYFFNYLTLKNKLSKLNKKYNHGKNL